MDHEKVQEALDELAAGSNELAVGHEKERLEQTALLKAVDGMISDLGTIRNLLADG